MLIVSYSGIDNTDFATKYSDNVIILPLDSTNLTNDILISYIELIKANLLNYDVVIIPYRQEVVICLDTLQIDFTVLYSDLDINEFHSERLMLNKLADTHNSIELENDEGLDKALVDLYDWIIKNDDKEVDNSSNIYSFDIADNGINTSADNTSDEVVEQNNFVFDFDSDKLSIVEKDKKKLTLQELIEQDIDITESDVRDIKSITNKFKVAMILQAQSRLKTVLKLCNVLDKLYDELINRVDGSLTTTDTASLMYTTEYIAKALSETNQFIMSMITNEKIQNFFVIDNSNIINITDNKVDLDKREKIRKATEIVLENTDYFTSGEYSKIINPNSVFENSEDDSNVNSTT